MIPPGGKVPPQDVSLEEKVLGAIIYGIGFGHNTMEASLKFLNADCFYRDRNQLLYKAMMEIHASGRKVTVPGITNKIKSEGWFGDAGGYVWIADLGKGYVNDSMFAEYCMILYEIYVKRKMMQLGMDLYNEACSETDPFVLREKTETFIREIKIITGGGKNQKDVYDETLKRFDDLENNRLVSIPTGFKSLDTFLGGWNKGDMIVVGSYTSNGKTSFAINTAYHAVSNKYPTKIYSFEMNSVELFKKQLALMVDYSPKAIEMDKRYRDEYVKQAMVHLSTYPMYYDHKCSFLGDWVADVRDAVKRGVQLVVVDYIQLMTAKQVKSRADDIGAIAREIKKLANELQIPIIALSQLNRPQGTTKAPPPSLKMLKESGEIEQSADIVIMPWIPSAEPTEEDTILYNSVTTKTKKENGDRLMVMKIPKGRNYGTTKFLAYIDGVQKIYEDSTKPDDFYMEWENRKEAPY